MWQRHYIVNLRSWVQWPELFIGVTQRDTGIHAWPRWKLIISCLMSSIGKLVFLLKRLIWTSYITTACPENTGTPLWRHSTITANYGDFFFFLDNLLKCRVDFPASSIKGFQKSLSSTRIFLSKLLDFLPHRSEISPSMPLTKLFATKPIFFKHFSLK